MIILRQKQYTTSQIFRDILSKEGKNYIKANGSKVALHIPDGELYKMGEVDKNIHVVRAPRKESYANNINIPGYYNYKGVGEVGKNIHVGRALRKESYANNIPGYYKGVMEYPETFKKAADLKKIMGLKGGTVTDIYKSILKKPMTDEKLARLRAVD